MNSAPSDLGLNVGDIEIYSAQLGLAVRMLTVLADDLEGEDEPRAERIRADLHAASDLVSAIARDFNEATGCSAYELPEETVRATERDLREVLAAGAQP